MHEQQLTDDANAIRQMLTDVGLPLFPDEIAVVSELIAAAQRQGFHTGWETGWTSGWYAGADFSQPGLTRNNTGH